MGLDWECTIHDGRFQQHSSEMRTQKNISAITVVALFAEDLLNHCDIEKAKNMVTHRKIVSRYNAKVRFKHTKPLHQYYTCDALKARTVHLIYYIKPTQL